MNSRRYGEIDPESPKDQLFMKIDNAFSEIAAAKGKAKKSTIRYCILTYGIQVSRALNYLLNPYIVFGIGEKSLAKPLTLNPERTFTDLFDLLDYLKDQPSVTDQTIANVQAFIQENEPFRELISGMVTKSIRLGVSAKTVNETLLQPYIPTFSCMLANKYFDHPDAVSGKSFAITEKLDGIRCIAMVTKDNVRLFSRQGQPITGLDEVESALANIRAVYSKDFVFDGELLVTDRDSIPSKEQYKRTTQIVRSTKAHKQGITYNVFDTLELDAFQSQQCEMPYYMRRQRLDVLGEIAHSPSIRVVPVEYMGNDVSQIQTQLNHQRALQHEGVMLNLLDATYQFTRTNQLLKVKVMNDCDLRIIGVEEGNGKFAGTLGSLVVDYKGNPVGVGSGLSDADRAAIWADPDAYIGRVATIQYFEETNDADGKLSIRFPVFKELCVEGKEVSYA